MSLHRILPGSCGRGPARSEGGEVRVLAGPGIRLEGFEPEHGVRERLELHPEVRRSDEPGGGHDLVPSASSSHRASSTTSRLMMTAASPGSRFSSLAMTSASAVTERCRAMRSPPTGGGSKAKELAREGSLRRPGSPAAAPPTRSLPNRIVSDRRDSNRRPGTDQPVIAQAARASPEMACVVPGWFARGGVLTGGTGVRENTGQPRTIIRARRRLRAGTGGVCLQRGVPIW
jgi:hypothetical protein